MDRQLKQIRLEPLANKQSNMEKTDSFNLRQGKKLKFRPANQNDRYHKTQPTVDNIIQEMPRKSSKLKSGFTEQYMSLVNKLKVNLSRSYFQKKEQILIVKKREVFYNDENLGKITNKISRNIRERNRRSFEQFSKDNQESIEKRSLTTVQKNSGRQIQTNRDEALPLQNDTNEYKTIYQSEKIHRIYPLLTGTEKNRYNQANLAQIQETNQHVQVNRKGASRISRKFSVLREERLNTAKPNEIYTHMETDKPEENELTEINQSYPQLDELCFHIEILIDIFESINNQTHKQERDGDQILIKILKEYVLGNKKSLPTKILTDDISHIDLIYTKQSKKRHLRNMVLSQRILIIISIDLLSNKKLNKYLPQINQILVSLMGIYLFLFYIYKKLRGQLSIECEKQLPIFQKKIHQHGIHIKKEINSANMFIQKKLFSVLKSNYTLHDQLKTLNTDFENKNVTINRAYYQILKLYAIYLNNHQVIIDRNPTLRTFATCPSPYLTKPNHNQYTLVLDLDQTLIYAESSKQKLEIFMRPFVKQFLETMSKHYEIIIFTSSMPQYSESIIAQLPFVTHKLFRHHCTRVKGRLIKDLLRIGRPLERTIIIDNEQQNFMLQKNNGIKLNEWRGDDPMDQQLNILGLFLNELASNNKQDVRQSLPNFIEFRNKYY